MMDQAPGSLFDRLVARVVAPDRGVALPFAPVFDTWGEEVDEQVSPDPEPVQAQVVQRSAAPAVAQPQETQTLPRRTGRAREEDRRRTHDAPPVRAVPTVVSRAAPDAAEAPVEFDQPAVPAARLAEEAPRPPRAQRPTAPGRRHDTPVPDDRSGWLRRVVPPVVATDARPIDRRPDDVVRSPAVREAAVPALPRVQPDLPTLIPEVARPAPVSEGSSAEPIVYVTIGRLEIRADDKARPARAPERPAAPSSLEQYLAKRGRGVS